MSFLKTLFWIVLAVTVALFSFANWTIVSVRLWDGLVMDIKLPVLLGFAFLLGLVPPLLLWQAARWRLRRQAMIHAGQAAMAAAPPAAPAGVAEPEPAPVSVGVAPVAIAPVPPGGA